MESLGIDSRISRHTLKESTEHLLRELLLRGKMKVGEIYSANGLAKELGISNSPVREAMMSLVDRRLLEIVRNRGFRVVELSSEDVHEIYQLRRLIEVGAVTMAAARSLSQEQVARVKVLAKKTDELHDPSSAGDLFEYLEADQEFHLYLVALNENRRWVDIVARLRDQSRVNGLYLHLMEYGRVGDTASEHLQLAEAVTSGSVQRAEQLMIEHLEYARPQ